MRIAHELIRVPVARHNQQVFACLLCFFGDCGNQVVTFKTGSIDRSDTHHLKHLFDDVHLLIQDVWLCFALCFVLWRGFVTKGFFFSIEHHNHAIWLMVLHQCQEH